MKVTVFSTDTCAPCAQLKRFLDYKKVDYENINLTEHPERSQEAYNLSGFSIVPVTVVENNDEKKVITGYNLRALIPALKTA